MTLAIHNNQTTLEKLHDHITQAIHFKKDMRAIGHIMKQSYEDKVKFLQARNCKFTKSYNMVFTRNIENKLHVLFKAIEDQYNYHAAHIHDLLANHEDYHRLSKVYMNKQSHYRHKRDVAIGLIIFSVFALIMIAAWVIQSLIGLSPSAETSLENLTPIAGTVPLFAGLIYNSFHQRKNIGLYNELINLFNMKQMFVNGHFSFHKSHVNRKLNRLQYNDHNHHPRTMHQKFAPPEKMNQSLGANHNIAA